MKRVLTTLILCAALGAPAEWQTELPGAATPHEHYPDVQVVVEEGLLAARVGSRVSLLRLQQGRGAP